MSGSTSNRQRLTTQRLFADPPLLGSPPANATISPDGNHVIFRAQAKDDRERFDLYRYDVETGATDSWIDARTITETSTDVTELTAAERAERERRRDFSHGIRSYSWRPGSDDLFLPIDGEGYVKASDAPAVRVTPVGTRQSAFTLSPTGQSLSYVRDGDLYRCDIDSGLETRVTEDASSTVTNGLPDFLAAEEMHRFEGHWWHPEESGLFYCRVDEAPVPISHRLELDANGARTIPQRYPYAGGPNPDVELRFTGLDGHTTTLWQSHHDRYLARVYLTKQRIVVLTQDRAQTTLRYEYLDLSDLRADAWRTLFEEVSSTWVNLSDDFTMLPDESVIVTDEIDGERQLRRLSFDGRHERLPSPSHVSRLLGYRDGRILAMGWDDTPLENHLFAIDSEGVTRLTSEAGWHEVTLASAGKRYLDQLSTPEVPARLSLGDLDGGAERIIYEDSINADHPYHSYLTMHAAPEFGSIDAADGQRLYYRLTPPAEREDGHRYPVIVYVYGGPGAQKARRDFGSLLLQLFAHHGFGVLELDNRGSGNRGRIFEAPIHRAMGTVEVDDQFAGMAVLRDQPWVDEARIGIFGHSYGGYMSLLCLSHPNSPFASGVSVAPVSDWSLYDSHYTERYMGTPEDNADGYARGNVLSRLKDLKRPLLLMHGMADDNVLFTHTTLIMGELQRLNTPFELMTYPGAKHSMQERHVSIHRFDLILDFFKRTL